MEVIPLVLEEVKVKTEVEEAPKVIIILTIVALITAIGEEAGVVLLEEIIMANKGIEILSTKVRIGKIDSGETKLDKVGAIITGIMTTKASMDEAGAVIIIIGDNKITTEEEAVAGISSKIMTRTVNHIGHMVTIARTPSHHNIMTNNPDQHSHKKQLTYVNCAIIKVTYITNANLQVILWLELSKPLIQVGNTTTKMHKVNGCKGIMIMKTPMISLFSRGGSRCY